jgi:hypothetical protein
MPIYKGMFSFIIAFAFYGEEWEKEGSSIWLIGVRYASL